MAETGHVGGETFGEQLVVISHGTDNAAAQAVKAATADLLDVIVGQVPAGRWRSEAITNIETGAMFAVKACYNPPVSQPQ